MSGRLRALLFTAGAAATAVAIAACNRPGLSPDTRPSALVVSHGGDPGALNPAVTTSGNTHPITDQIFNGLVGLDQDLNPVPELAERWAVEDDGRTYRFALRRDVRWHDGVPFTSADVKFTFEEALLKYHSRTRAALEHAFAGIDTPDAHTVVFRLRRPYGPLLQRLDVVEASIIAKHQYAGHDLLNGAPTRTPIGTGPFRFVSYAPGDRVVLEPIALVAGHPAHSLGEIRTSGFVVQSTLLQLEDEGFAACTQVTILGVAFDEINLVRPWRLRRAFSCRARWLRRGRKDL